MATQVTISLPDDLYQGEDEGFLTIPEQSELLGLMQGYQEEWLRKTQALCEAIKRGLCKRIGQLIFFVFFPFKKEENQQYDECKNEC